MTATAEQLADGLANLTARLRLALDHLEAADDPEGADVLFMAPDLLSALDDLEGVARKGDVADAQFEWMEAEDQLIALVDLADQLAPPRLEWITFSDSRELGMDDAELLEEESLPPFPPAGWVVVRPGGNEVH